MKKFGFVYIWRDRKHNRYYIGCHWGTENDNYVCSSNWMYNAWKRRKEDFKRRILTSNINSLKEMFDEEHKWLSLIKKEELKVKYYNIHKHHSNHWANLSKEEQIAVKKSISEKTKEAMNKPEIREKYIIGLKNRDTSWASNTEILAQKSASMMGKNKGRVMEGQALENIQKAAKNRTINIKALSRGGTSACNIINAQKVKCSKCGFEANPGLIARHHNDNCKKIDWNTVKTDFESGVFSFRELGRKYNIDRRVIKNRLING